tara:strand:- start:377 stop:577 length:201 start_codon:yes stop_codon:yes gene_type:complete
MTIDDMEQDLLADYHRLRAGLENMIGSGRLREGDIPDDWQWLTDALAGIAEDTKKLADALEEEGGL